MKTNAVIVFCALYCVVQCLAEKSVVLKNTCPDLTLSNENPWCLNCTFYDENQCETENDNTITDFDYKIFKCPDKSNCILPQRWNIRHKNEIDEMGTSLENCPDMDKNKPNFLCNNCTTVKDTYCYYTFFGIQCALREHRCPEYNDRSCNVLHNCTAPHIDTFPMFKPKLTSLDGKGELEAKKEGDCSVTPILEENPGCVNCLFVKKYKCRVVTNYTETTCMYNEFKCPQKCVLPENCVTYYDGDQQDINFCPDLKRNEPNTHCTNCLHIRDFSCSYARNWYTHANCFYKEYVCPEYNDRYCVKLKSCVAPVGGVPLYSSDINPTALASLAGAG